MARAAYPSSASPLLGVLVLRRMSRWVAAGAGVLTVTITALLGVEQLRDPERFPLLKVAVDGELRYLDRTKLREVVIDAIDGNFFTVDMPAVRERVQALPWVDDASVRRVWPDTLTMEVVEQSPYAIWGTSKLVNARGDVFAPGVLPETLALVRLYGPAGRAADVIAFHRIAADQCEGVGLAVSRLGLNEQREWHIEFRDTPLRLVLGARSSAQRLARFVEVYPVLVADQTRRPVRVDMRYPNGFAVSWEALQAPNSSTLRNNEDHA